MKTQQILNNCVTAKENGIWDNGLFQESLLMMLHEINQTLNIIANAIAVDKIEPF